MTEQAKTLIGVVDSLVRDWELEKPSAIDMADVDTVNEDIASAAEEERDERGGGDQEQDPSSVLPTPESIAEGYMATLREQSGLHVTIRGLVSSAYGKNADYVFFSLFFSCIFKERLRRWTPAVLVKARRTAITESEFNA
ncbi:hypothetical protein GN958_ATG01907 [Phytophthora infestans]|uniref:Uncharacterized protein n=1 Tax=Phytophthora infestans TaxID=4787 RepID=A0A8S9V8H6_PHYIN|nr:hypothetical protein GN958_ATG01907 [Phytophthora infestans]